MNQVLWKSKPGKRLELLVVVENHAEVMEARAIECSFPINCTLLNLHIKEQAPTAMMMHAGNMYVRMRSDLNTTYMYP